MNEELMNWKKKRKKREKYNKKAIKFSKHIFANLNVERLVLYPKDHLPEMIKQQTNLDLNDDLIDLVIADLQKDNFIHEAQCIYFNW